MVTIHPHFVQGHTKIMIKISDDQQPFNGLLLLCNAHGDEIMRRTLSGCYHDIDISPYNLSAVYVKLETSHCTIVKRLQLQV